MTFSQILENTYIYTYTDKTRNVLDRSLARNRLHTSIRINSIFLIKGLFLKVMGRL